MSKTPNKKPRAPATADALAEAQARVRLLRDSYLGRCGAVIPLARPVASAVCERGWAEPTQEALTAP
jgi:hypothetical protein